jgi:hypothetical protein
MHRIAMHADKIQERIFISWRSREQAPDSKRHAPMSDTPGRT